MKGPGYWGVWSVAIAGPSLLGDRSMSRMSTWVPEYRPAHAPFAAFSEAILASIFRRAAKIISSRLRCKEACLSSRFELQPLVLASACCADSVVMRSCSLYLVIRSGSGGFEGFLAAGDPEADGGVVDGGGGGGWNLAGGCDGQESARWFNVGDRRDASRKYNAVAFIRKQMTTRRGEARR